MNWVNGNVLHVDIDAIFPGFKKRSKKVKEYPKFEISFEKDEDSVELQLDQCRLLGKDRQSLERQWQQMFHVVMDMLKGLDKLEKDD